MDNLNIKVTRDSVCMGDDCSAPHSLKFSVPKDSSLEYMFGLLKDKKYLATVKGESHSWKAKISNELIAQVEGNSRTALIELGVSKETFNYSKDNEVQIHFEYVWKKI